ncbi:MAG: GTPase [Promethearchaeota archaeon]
MPTNLTAEAQAAWDKYLDASTTTEKIAALEEFISECPKHKGVEKHLKTAKVRLSKLKLQQEKERQKRKSTARFEWMVPKEEDAQIVLIGAPNAGKSAVLNLISRSEAAKVASYPFTTTKPKIATIETKGARMQLVELPAIIEGSSKGEMQGKLVLASIRNADALLIVVDLSADPISQLNTIFRELHLGKIRITTKLPGVDVEKVGSGGLQIFNPELFEGGKEGAVEILSRKGYSNAVVRFYESVTIEEFLDILSKSVVRKKTMIFANKGDKENSKQRYQELLTYIKENKFPLEIIPISTEREETFINLEEEIFALIDSIRVYTRDSDSRIAPKPIVLHKENNSVEEAVKIISKKMLEHFRYARIWGSSVKFDGQKVGLGHQLEDGDCIQVFA